MKKKEKAYSIALASTVIILFLILVSSLASASPGQNPPSATIPPSITSGAGDPSDDKVPSDELSTEGNGAVTESIQAAVPKITETQITTNASDQWNPVIYGNKIAWEDYRNGNVGIYIYDIPAKKVISTITSESDQYCPDIYDNKVVWMDNIWAIYMYDLSTKKKTQINTIGSAYFPAIYGDKIVWEGSYYGDEGGSDIHMYDISTKKETQITDSGSAYSPAIFGNKIVWEDYRNGNSDRNGNGDIYMYDLSTKKETQITSNGSTQMAPAIYGNRILWQDDRNGNWDIYMYDISTKKEKRITTNPSASYSPAIYGDRIAWMDDRNGNWDIYVYDLAAYQESHTTDKSNQYYPDIYGDKIVWMDDRNGNYDIYMGTLSTFPVAAFSAKPTSGKAPLKVTFTDKSTGSPTSWKWSFGDKTYSTAKSPVHKYTNAGKYTVSLTVKNAAGSNTKTMSGYIKVSKK